MRLETDRLVLREIEPRDWEAMYAYQNDPLYLRYYPFDGRTPEDVHGFVHRLIDFQNEEPRTKFQLAITRDGKLIGNCGIRMVSRDAPEADIGYELAPDRWGQGMATEAVRAMVDFGFRELGLHRVWSWTTADNVGSWRVMQKLGMRLEGRQREKEFYKGRWWDTVLYGLLEKEWRSDR